MRHLAVAIIVFWATTSSAQIFEAGPYMGGSNFIGDVGATNYIKPNRWAFGGIVKWNRSERHSYRLSIIHTSLRANDERSDQERRQERGYAFSNGLTEFSLGMEFTFWDWNLYEFRSQVVPYLASGLTGILTHDMRVNEDENRIEKEGRKIGMSLPMILGVKATLRGALVLAFEVGARLAFTDNLDGSSPGHGKGFGNSTTNDWYMFTGISMTYTFGKFACYDPF